MKKLFVDNTGQVVLKETNEPTIESVGSLVATNFALISAGTELLTIEGTKFRNQPLILQFLKSKDFRREALSIFKKISLKKFYHLFRELSGKKSYKNFKGSSINLRPIGYSCSGIIQETNVEEYRKGDRVACAGSNHAEVIFSPKNLSCKVPENVSLEEAAFATLGAIALHGIHRADIKPGEYVGIIGTGLIGLLVVQLAKFCGAEVVAFDLINERLKLSKKMGADLIINPLNHNSIHEINELTNGYGLDSIIICASSKSSKPLEEAVNLIRSNGKIVILGAIPVNIDRSKLYYKEPDLLISRSYGPGRYDPYYEYEAHDYPIKYVPWTENRNMELFLKLISERKINVRSLITDIYPIKEANLAYEKLANDPVNTIAVLLNFYEKDYYKKVESEVIKYKEVKGKLTVGLIGCGSFAQIHHVPHLLSFPNCEIRAIVTNHKKTADYCMENFRPKYVSTNYKEILNDPEINTVFIYTRHNLHAEITLEAIRANKNVYCEKPMGITLEECEAVYKSVINSNKLYTIGFNRRFSIFIQKAKELLLKRENPILINYRIANKYISGNSWIFDEDIGGGPLIGELCHFTDLILYLMNSKPIEVVAYGGSLSHKNLKVYDSCNATIKFENGSIANIMYSDLNSPNLPKERIEIFSGESGIIIDDFIKMNTDGFDAGNILLKNQDKGHLNELKSFINANLRLQSHLVNVNDALKAMDLCFKIIESIKTKKSIKIEGKIYE